MKLHLPRLLSAALLAACVSAPVYSASIPDGYTEVHLEEPDLLKQPNNTYSMGLLLYDGKNYSYNRIGSTATDPFYSKGYSLFFTSAEGQSSVTMSFIGGDTKAFSSVSHLTFADMKKLSFSAMTSGVIYTSGASSHFTISGVKDNTTTTPDVLFLNNSITGGCGGAIAAKGENSDILSPTEVNVFIKDNGDVLFQGNNALAKNVSSGSQTQGITERAGISSSSAWSLDLFGLQLSFDFGFGLGFNYEEDNPETPEVEMDICGGAINLVDSKLTMSGNKTVSFIGNSAVDYGGAIATEMGYANVIDISSNGKVIFQENLAAGHVKDNHVNGGVGGAIAIGNNGRLMMAGNTGDIEFKKNLAAAAGGAIYHGGKPHDYSEKNDLLWSENEGKILFEENVTGGAGGAIYTLAGAGIKMSKNTGDISFVNNKAGVSGGAISALDAYVTLEHNGNILFSDNLVFHQNLNSAETDSFPTYYTGGAIYGSNIQIHNNESVIFQRNAEIAGDGSFRLRSLYTDFTPGKDDISEVSLSAGEGKSIEFRDSIYVRHAMLHLNSEYDEKQQNGDIIFTGEYTVDDLRTVKEGWLGKDATIVVTDKEIENSRTSIVLHNTNLNGGRLRVEKGAIFKGIGIYVNNGTLRIDDAKVVNIKNSGDTAINDTNIPVKVGTGATLEILGHSTIEGGTLKFSDASNWNVHLTKDNVGNSNAALTLKNSLMNIEGKLTLTLNLSGSNFNEAFCLLNGAGASSEKWIKENITVVGTGDAAGATFDDLYWLNGALYYENSLVWTNGEGTSLWNNDAKNWLNDRAFHYGANTKFTDVGEGGTVTLVGKIASAKVTVDNSKGVDYTFTGKADENGEEAGFLPGTDIVKRGDGALTLDVATEQDGTNDYGRVSLEEGTLNLHDDNALGGSVLKTAEGTTLAVGDASHVVLQDNQLQDADHDIKGDVVVAEGSSLKIASGSYAASSSNVDGELIFNGQRAWNAGSLSGSGSLEVTNGASVTFKDASGFTGNVSVTGSSSSLFLTIADGILRAGEIAVNAGDLTLRASEQLTMAGGTVLSMVAGTVAEKVTTVVADKVIALAGNAMLAAMMNSMLGDLDKDGILNEDAAAEVVGAGITLNAGSTLKLENCHIRLEGDNSCLTLNITPESTEKINLVLLPDDILTEDSVVQLFSGADKVNFVYDGTIISGNGHYECDANHYFTGSMVGAGTKLVYDNGNVYMKGLVPEPTTATLSLLALAALATRRRRR